MSFSGSLDPDDANTVALIEFSTFGDAAFEAQSWGFGGSASAPGGTNAAGTLISGGGFDSYLSLFAGWGGAATFVSSNDDGACPPATALPTCSDSTLSLPSLAAGNYTLAMSVFGNASFAENSGSGTLGDGFIGLGSYGSRTPAWAVDIGSPALVPEPATSAMLLAGILFLAGLARRRLVAAPAAPAAAPSLS
jgi:hypothetical protein